MAIEDGLLQASFKGFQFLMPADEETAGRKVVVHEYPGSDQRSIQDLGKLQPVFSIPAIIHGPNYISDRQRFSQILQSEGPGTLVHPYFGEIQCQVIDYSSRSNEEALGEIVYSIQLFQTEEPLGLFGDATGLTEVFDAADNARTSLGEALFGRYNPMNAVKSIQRVGARIDEAMSVVQSEVSSVVNPIADVLNETTRVIENTKADILSIARTPANITNAFNSLFFSFSRITELPQDIAREWDNFTNFGAPIRTKSNGQKSKVVGSIRPTINRTTKTREIEDDNFRFIDQFIRIHGLIGSLEAVAASDFQTDDDIINARQDLSDTYNRVILNQDDVRNTSNIGDEILTDASVVIRSNVVNEAEAFANGLASDPQLRSDLERLRVAALNVIVDDIKNTYKITEFDVQETDILLATHRIYGNLNNLDIVASLNSNLNLSFISQPIKGIVE